MSQLSQHDEARNIFSRYFYDQTFSMCSLDIPLLFVFCEFNIVNALIELEVRTPNLQQFVKNDKKIKAVYFFTSF